MTELSYKDSEDALYMQRKFGVYFQGLYLNTSPGAINRISPKGNVRSDYDLIKLLIEQEGKAYIHKDSHEIFELRVDDIVTFNYKGRDQYNCYWIEEDEDRAAQIERHTENKIIQRNNLSFIMPEREE